MTGLTYAGPPARTEQNILLVHQFMKSPTQIARRLRQLTDERFIADAILTKRFVATGGGVFYTTGEQLFAPGHARPVAQGAEYRKVVLGGGEIVAAKTDKLGIATNVYDEAIARQVRQPVDDAFTLLSNTIVADVDATAMSVITSSITQTHNSASKWTDGTAKAILASVMRPKAKMANLKIGLNPDTVVVDEELWTEAMLAFVDAGYTPKETVTSNPALTGEFPVIGGMKWLTSPHAIEGIPLVLDSKRLGGMGDEDLQSPGFVKAGNGAEVFSERLQGVDGYGLRARRVTVAVVDEPRAGFKVTGAK